MAEELTAKEQLEQMINGTHENVEFEDEIDDDVAEEQEQEVEDEINEDNESEPEVEENTEDSEDIENGLEDTDQETESDEEEDTEQEDDDVPEETSDTDDEVQEENAQETVEVSENELEKDGTAEPDYKDFYEKVALAKFTANGREVEGFKNPEDLIRAQQMLHGYSDKMKVFKEYKPFLKALEERQITEDSDKFNLAMSLLDGDEEAIKTVLKDKKIDPMELDLEDIHYTPKNVLPSNAQLLIEESYEQAENLGIADKFNKVISKDWDVQSLQEFIENGAVRNDLMQHLKDGTYDIVQNEINKMELLDSTGVLDGMSSIEKYRTAISRLQQNAPKQVTPKPKIADTTEVDKITAESKAKEAEAYKRKAAEKEKKVAENRKKAASVSKKKVSSKPKPKPRLEELKGEEFRNAFKNMLMS